MSITTCLEEAKRHYDAGRRIMAFFINKKGEKQPCTSAKANDYEAVYFKSCSAMKRNPNKYYLALCCGEEAKMTLVDIDCHNGANGVEAFEQVAKKHNYEGLDSAVKATTPSGGLHYYFKYTPELAHGQNKLFKLDGDWVAVDVRNKDTCGFGICYPSKGYTWVRSPFDCPLTDCPQWVIDWHKQSVVKKSSKEKKPKSKKSQQHVSFDTLSNVVQNLSSCRSDDYTSWYKVVASIARTAKESNYVNQALELAQSFSKRTKGKYDSTAVEEKFNHFLNNDDEGVTFGSLVYWLKEDNPEAHTKLFGSDRKSYTEVKQEFEKQVFKVLNPYMFCRDIDGKELQIMDRKTLKGVYENLWYWKYDHEKETLVQEPFIRDWLKDATARTYEQLDFLPPPLVCPEGVYNMFKGLRAETLEDTDSTEGLEAVKTHVRRMCGGDDKCYNYVIKWLAQRVQRPGELPRVALIFQSEQGSGKNLFWDFFGKKVLGYQYYFLTPDINNLLGRFAEGLKHRLNIVLDETSGKDTFQNNELIKGQITSDVLQYEKKFCPMVPLTNCCAWVFITNNEIPVKIEYSDRRFVLVEGLNDRLNDPTYFKPLVQHLVSDATAKAFYDFLKSVDISDFDPVNERPMTEAYQAVKEASTPAVARFVKDYIDEMQEDEKVLPVKDLYTDFQGWCERERSANSMNSRSFGIHIRRWLGNDKNDNKIRTASSRVVLINKKRVVGVFRQKNIFVRDYEDTSFF